MLTNFRSAHDGLLGYPPNEQLSEVGTMAPPAVSGSVTSFRMSHEIVPVPRTIMSRHIVPVKNHMPCNTPKLPQTR